MGSSSSKPSRRRHGRRSSNTRIPPMYAPPFIPGGDHGGGFAHGAGHPYRGGFGPQGSLPRRGRKQGAPEWVNQAFRRSGVTEEAQRILYEAEVRDAPGVEAAQERQMEANGVSRDVLDRMIQEKRRRGGGGGGAMGDGYGRGMGGRRGGRGMGGGAFRRY
ncbi:hypothetical protein EJ08DRAFT_450114 [Tothia fuscella]|uniref:Uncharacterized protein n=1 Tax=Tothia fuscella TaxID=1048955 RepID=A0A9P4NIX5_9PEZI|nr:hypothetical protein EJ08DRAFT_450114 [Tothia fuscella]